MPGLHAVVYVPGSVTFTVSVREVPGPMPSIQERFGSKCNAVIPQSNGRAATRRSYW
ncbi:hypothetical protein ACWGGS_02190 [Streptomyces decoyicus]